MAEPVTVKLRQPIHFGSQVVEELTVRPVKGRDLRRIQAPQDRQLQLTMELAGYLTGQVREVIDELEGEDLVEVLTVVASFFSGSPLTGSEP